MKNVRMIAVRVDTTDVLSGKMKGFRIKMED
jgi:hypothetical protein